MASFAFLVRTYFYKDCRLAEIERIVVLKNLHIIFYTAFQKGYCKKNKKVLQLFMNTAMILRENYLLPQNFYPIPPNVHAFFHLLEDRKTNGPLWMTTTEPYESLYGTLRNLYHPGTRNIPRQIMTNFYLRDRYVYHDRIRSGHICIATVFQLQAPLPRQEEARTQT